MRKKKQKGIFDIWMTITDENGKIESHRRVHSPVRAMIDLIYAFLAQAGVTNGCSDVSGNPQTSTNNSVTFAANAASANNLFGIVVGLTSSTITVIQTALASIISHGTGTDNLQYGAMGFIAPITSGSSRLFTMSRTFTNNSSYAVIVNEVGIYVKGSNAPFYVMIDRTLNTFTVNVGASKTVTYTISVTV